ncbi:hypothetical protein P4S93_09325 [Aneurinibacillus thermoaerophilus]|uniref:Uncharacterized protein n=1 Tax=Aneurinibacillus thermoaerophilus TaxID=143495 RepID=A0A1G7YUS9_ANETH|nr:MULTISPECIES: hypothetical protein [Aneurinibacillus]MED0674379.1 hypothetical protein [Aneurinibacillus thermoaerophilus]MED0758710.1 hypothetical protein [Aneurinibacillus thermoaerophilus]MED0760979.1 hypothetical protein [Aneurinibacillus thermoaerophilus]QYY44254.1 hypothetical protein K3F53_08790 [Aneurinibacillus thermoaerophilus]SDH00147.1 hypothetical protein SAMN04489735_10084 [Aneurinibacillus thermoaerophilus]
MKDCVICGKETEDICICQVCMDVQEFGYPSFPAYALVEKEETEEKVLELVG